MQQQIQQFNNLLSEMVRDPEGEKEVALNNFRGGLVVMLDASSPEFFEILEDYNHVLILLLASDSRFIISMRNALIGNDEKITVENIKIDDVVKEPTIANWIVDFIKSNGSGIFDSIGLSKYMTSSPNVARLSYNERRLVKKLLLLYRNLMFFPDSLKDIPPEYWEMFPIDKEGGEIVEMKHSLGLPKTEEEKEVEELKNMESEYQEGSLEQLALEEEIVNRKKVEELKMMAKKYAEGSLERKVVEEEIKKLEVRS